MTVHGYNAAADAARAAHDREVLVLSAALFVLSEGDESITRAAEPGSLTDEEVVRFAAKMREAQRLARLYARTWCRDVERMALDDVTVLLRDALAETPDGSP